MYAPLLTLTPLIEAEARAVCSSVNNLPSPFHLGFGRLDVQILPLPTPNAYNSPTGLFGNAENGIAHGSDSRGRLSFMGLMPVCIRNGNAYGFCMVDTMAGGTPV